MFLLLPGEGVEVRYKDRLPQQKIQLFTSSSAAGAIWPGGIFGVAVADAVFPSMFPRVLGAL